MNHSAGFFPISIEQLYKRIDTEYKIRKEIFGIPEALFFNPVIYNGPKTEIFGHPLDTPFGVAAGPHSQLAQNIITAWLCGGSYIELKTVQTLDELNVSKPCIDMQDEGYNCEWSQELRIHESYAEYLKAWILIHVLSRRLGRESGNHGFVFNMSVGYNYEGILKDNVQWFLSKMKDCSQEKGQMLKALAHFGPEIETIEIPDCISDNITLSTMHGCPPDEIEKIGHYLLSVKKLHTFVKLNPTLLGKEELRNILNTRLGFKTTVPDEAFEHDLKYRDAIGIISRLQETAGKEGLIFGVKLTNTLESLNHKTIFPENEKMMYMSGRALHPISVNVARKLQNEFNGKLTISFSGGADCFNVSDLLRCGLRPVTVSSDLLKPGGYGRLSQYAEHLTTTGTPAAENPLEYLNTYADAVLLNESYHNDPFQTKTIKSARTLELFDCIQAPCTDECPTSQDVPEYMFHTAEGNPQKAFDDILNKNPFPNVLGSACDHSCQTKCTRINYDQPLKIRDIKLFVAGHAMEPEIIQIPENGKKVAVIGAGPSGLACAWFLRHYGFAVDIYESKPAAGGMVNDAIPGFRMKIDLLYKDIQRIEKSGARIYYNSPVDHLEFRRLREGYDFVYIGAGAQRFRSLGLPGEEAAGMINPFDFLKRAKKGEITFTGKHVLIIGGGNTAVDCARTARRLLGKEGYVKVVYRRTRFEMPADPEEIEALLSEDIEMLELLAPAAINVSEGRIVSLACTRMKLESSGPGKRPVPVSTGESPLVLEADVIIPALGQEIDIDFTDPSVLKTRTNSCETQLDGLFIGGDARRGAATIVKAVGDGRKAASEMALKAGLQPQMSELRAEKHLSLSELTLRRAKRISMNETIRGFQTKLNEQQAREEAGRCLLCNEACNVCVSVCPNRANVYYTTQKARIPVWKIEPAGTGFRYNKIDERRINQKIQVLNIADFCNECGNCTTFCPSSGAPFRDKPRFCLTEACFRQTENSYFLKLKGNEQTIFYNSGRQVSSLTKTEREYLFTNPELEIRFSNESFIPISIAASGSAAQEVSTQQAATMKVLLDADLLI